MDVTFVTSIDFYYPYICNHRFTDLQSITKFPLHSGMNDMAKSYYIGILTVVCCLAAHLTAAAHPDDNVYLTDGTETWHLTISGDGSPVVRNTISHVYEATRYAENIQPFVTYNDRMKLDKASGKGKARHENATSYNVFHDDNRVCYFDMRLEGPGKKAKVQFERTLTDPAFFGRIYLADTYPIRHKELRVIIPAEFSRVTIEELNFIPAEGSPISRRIEDASDGTRTYIYALDGLEGTSRQEEEKGSPNPLLYQPVLLVKGWFGSVDDLSAWHRDMTRVDTDIPDAARFLAEEVYGTDGKSMTARERIARIYAWVQRNIRYIAYEEGESGHRPDRPAEVLRKRYGDCKGMALLLATLLRHEGIEAQAAVIGTDDIPFSITSNPSVAATDHSVCMAVEGSDTLWLDATNEYIPVGHIPSGIQGKDAILLPFGDGACRLVDVPVLAPSETALDSVCYSYTLIPGEGELQGAVTRVLGGDFKELYLTRYKDKGEKYEVENMAVDLVPLRRSSIPQEDVSVEYDNQDGMAVIAAPISNSEAVTDAGDAIYVNLDSRNGLPLGRIADHDRRAPYRFPTRGRIVRRAQLTVPQGCAITHIPENYSATTPHARFSCTFTMPSRDTVVMEKSVEITDPFLSVDDLALWNSTISAWDNACGNQIEIMTVK